jgi:hypothetical protein
MSATKDKGLTTPHSQPSKTPSKNANIVPLATPECNEFTAVARELARRGHDLARCESGSHVSYFVTNRSRALLMTSWLAVKTLLAHVKGAA